MPTGVYEEKHKNPKMSYQDPPQKNKNLQNYILEDKINCESSLINK